MTFSESKRLTGHTKTVNSVAFSPDGARVVSGSDDSTVKIWNAANGKLERTLNLQDEEVISVAFSPDGTKIVSGTIHQIPGTTSWTEGGIGKVKIWNADNDEKLGKTFHYRHGSLKSVAFSPDGTKIVLGGVSEGPYKRIYIWDFETDKEKTLIGHNGTVNSVAFYGTKVVSGSNDRNVKIWNAETGVEEQTLRGHSWSVTSVAFDGTRIVSGSNDNTVKIWKLNDKNEWVLDKTLEGHSKEVTSVAIDGTRVVSGSKDKTVKIWNAVTGVLEQTLTGHTSFVTSVAINEMRIVSGSYDKTAIIWEDVTSTAYATLAALNRKDRLYGENRETYVSKSEDLGKLMEKLPPDTRKYMLSFLTGTKYGGRRKTKRNQKSRQNKKSKRKHKRKTKRKFNL
jgi:WD40 repeat protein